MKREVFSTTFEVEMEPEDAASLIANSNIRRIDKSFKEVITYLGYNDVDMSFDIDPVAFQKDDINNLLTLCVPYDKDLTPSIIITIDGVKEKERNEIAFLFNLINSKFIPLKNEMFFEKINKILNKHYPEERPWPDYNDITETLLTICFENDFFPILSNQFVAVTYAAKMCVDDAETPSKQKLNLLLKLMQHYEQVKKRRGFDLVHLYMSEGKYAEALDILLPYITPGHTSSWIAEYILNAKYKLNLPVSVNELFALGRKNTKFVKDKIPMLYDEAEKIFADWTKKNGDFLTYIYEKYKKVKTAKYKLMGFEYFSFSSITEVLHFVENLSRLAENVLRRKEGLKELKIDIKHI